MIETGKVNRIWLALHEAKIALFEQGPVRMSTGRIVDFIVDNAAVAFARISPEEPVSREEIVEAWLYQVLGRLALSNGVEPLPKTN